VRRQSPRFEAVLQSVLYVASAVTLRVEGHRRMGLMLRATCVCTNKALQSRLRSAL